MPVQNSMLFTAALIEWGVPVEQHIFSEGEHGIALGSDQVINEQEGHGLAKRWQIWIDLAIEWIRDLQA